MKRFVEFTDNFEIYDSRNPLHEHSFSLLIIHDNTKQYISSKFLFKFLNPENETIEFWDINSWIINKISTGAYFGRAKIYIELRDPDGNEVNGLESSGSSLANDEKWNMECIVDKLLEVLPKIKLNSFFKNNRSKLDFINYCNERGSECYLSSGDRIGF